jgi:hypothetical protein
MIALRTGVRIRGARPLADGETDRHTETGRSPVMQQRRIEV